MKTLAVIPARGGSKGLPGKNARPFLGVSLLERAIRIGMKTCDRVVVTTDSEEYADIARTYVVDVHMRPAELAADEAPMLPVVQDAIRGREGDVIVLLQPTQPLRTVEQVGKAIALLGAGTSVVSVKRVPDVYAPDRLLHYDIRTDTLVPATGQGGRIGRRQEARKAYVRDGTVYVVKRETILGGSLYGHDCRHLILEGDALSIDTLEDFERLEALARRSHGEEKAQAQATPGVLK